MDTCHLCLPRPRLRGDGNGRSDLLYPVRVAGWVVPRAENHRWPSAGRADTRQGADVGGTHLGIHLRNDGLAMGAFRGHAVRSAGGPGELRHAFHPIRTPGELHRVVGADDLDLAILAIDDDALGVALDAAVAIEARYENRRRASWLCLTTACTLTRRFAPQPTGGMAK